MKIVKIFDEKGLSVTVGNMKLFSDMENTLLVRVYKSTIYEHELIMALEELVEKKIIPPSNIPKYNPKPVLEGISLLQAEVIKRWDVKTHDKIISDIDLSFLDKKPKDLK